MSLERFEVGLVKITVGLIVLLTVALAFNFLGLRPRQKLNFQADRSPSSLPNDALIAAPEARARAPRLTPPCLRHGENHQLRSVEKRVRLIASLCPQLPALRESRIINKTNGFVATSFHLSKTQLTTDLIDLSPGPNNILISIKGESGPEIVSELFVNH